MLHLMSLHIKFLHMKNLIYVSFVLAFLFSSCIEEYKIPTGKSNVFQPEIVINGRIQAGDNTLVYISYTQPLGSDEEVKYVHDAEVQIIGKNGYSSELAKFDADNGCYIINTRELSNNTTYALKVEANGETYQSDFLELLDTPEIDNVTYKEREDGISIHVSTHNNNEASRYYFWSYEEDWEFHPPVDIIGLGGGILVYSKKFYETLEGSNLYNHYYYCWKHAKSANIHIYATNQLEENAVKEVEMFRIPIDDIRISYIYSILVKQCSINEKAYNYYRTLEKQTEENEGLFTPMPMEIKGNITCLTNPSVNVKGYVLASNVSTKRIFIYESDFKTIRSEYDADCLILTPDLYDPSWYERWTTLMNKWGAVIMTKNGDYNPYNNPDYIMSTLYHRECVDCRAVKGATKKRPDFWPNNHE